MADFALDENVSERTADVLDDLEHDVLTTRQNRSQGIDDARQLALAARAGRLFVTYNRRDFLLLHCAWRLWSHDWGVAGRAHHAGILLLPQPPILAAERAAYLLDQFVRDRVVATNRFFAWSSHDGWTPEG